jgi:hypothetical protein
MMLFTEIGFGDLLKGLLISFQFLVFSFQNQSKPGGHSKLDNRKLKTEN